MSIDKPRCTFTHTCLTVFSISRQSTTGDRMGSVRRNTSKYFS